MYLDQPIRFIIKDYLSYSSDDARAVTDAGIVVLGYPIGYSRCYKSVFYGDIVSVNIYLYPWP